VPRHEELDVFHVQAAPATNERAKHGSDGEVEEGESHAADPLSPLAPPPRHRYWRASGPTSVYALMQNVGMVNDHVHGCFRTTDYPATSRGR
jgi:DNA-3-methyladenine glycosylase I